MAVFSVILAGLFMLVVFGGALIGIGLLIASLVLFLGKKNNKLARIFLIVGIVLEIPLAIVLILAAAMA